MSEQTCDCHESTTQQIEDIDRSNRWLDERPVTEAALPPDVQQNMSQFLDKSIGTLADFVTAIRGAVDQELLTIENLCHAEDKTPHRATVGGERYTFECFYDGIALAYLVEEPVEIRTESPAGKPIELVASPEGTIDVTPSDAVMSFGIASNVDSSSADGPPVDEAAIATMCPYVRAFTSRTSYESWAAGVDAATVGMPLTAGVPIAAALTEET